MGIHILSSKIFDLLFKRCKDSLLVFKLDDQDEIKDFKVSNVKVRDGWEEYSDVDTDSDDWRLMSNWQGSIYITSEHFHHNGRSYKSYNL